MPIYPPPSITSTTNMMKSGLCQNEKLKALRIVIDNVVFDTANEVLRKVVPFEKKLKEFVGAGIEPPSAYGAADLMDFFLRNRLISMHSKPIAPKKIT